MISRRAWLAGAALAACGRKHPSGFPGHVFVGNAEGRSVAAVDLTRFAVTRHIGLEAAPVALVADRARPLVYVLAAGTVYAVDAQGIRSKTRVASAAAGLRLGPDGRSLWVLCREPRRLLRLHLDTLRPGEAWELPSPPEDFDISREQTPAVSVRDAVLIGRRAVPLAAPGAVRFRSDGRLLLAAHRGQRALTVLDAAAARPVVRLPLPFEPRHFCFTPDGGQLFLSGPGADGVSIVFPYSTEVAETILVGKAPAGMAISASPLYLFVASPASDSVSVFDVETRKLLTIVNVGRQPRHVLITPDNQYTLVLNEQSGDLAVIWISALNRTFARRYRLAPLFTMIPVGPRPASAAVVSG